MRGVVWLLVLGLFIYRLYQNPAAVERIRLSVLHAWPLWICAAIWASFSILWEVASRNTSSDKTSESSSARTLHVLMVNVALLLVFLPVRGLTQRFVPVSAAISIVGLTLQFAGLLFAVWARRHLGRNWSGRISIKVDHELIRTGPYRLIRHPIYTGFLGMFAASVLVSGEVHAVAGLALAIFAYWRKLRIEEANLAAVFGAEWTEYRASSWALAPGLY
jgi:protein-S-isoprenylcysteine O-methyltransferase Ste14